MKKTFIFALLVSLFAGLSVHAEEKKKARPGPEAMFAKLDADANKAVSKVEFVDGQKAMAKARAEKADKLDDFDAMWEKRGKSLDARFTKADADGNGSLSMAEFAASAPAPKGPKGKKPAGE